MTVFADQPPIALPNMRTVVSRRRFFKQLAAMATVPLAAGAYSREVEPFWPRIHEVPLRIAGLPPSFENFRIAQVTDMHAGRVPMNYLETVMQRIDALKPDLLAFTGDLIHHNSAWVDAVTQMLKIFSVPVIVSFGNHEFGVGRGPKDPYDPDLAENFQSTLNAAGYHVLRNASMPIEHADGRLWLSGLDDLWFGEFNPTRAFRDVAPNEPVIAMSHNPDTAEMLAPFHPDLILSGHTHGGQIRLPFYGAIRLNVAQPQYDVGHFQLPNSQLYVSAGVGYILKVRFNCRPEVPIFRLMRA